MESKHSLSWLFKMAIRDSRRNRSRLLLFLSSITVGIAALVAINSFGKNLSDDLARESKSLLGADLVLEGNQIPSEQLSNFIDSLPGQKSSALSFASMVALPRQAESRLCFIKAIEGEYPLYGNLNTAPLVKADVLQKGDIALVDKSIFDQYNLKVGDPVKIGELEYQVEAALNAIPGQAGISSAIAPTIYIPKARVAETGLLKTGSRVEYNYYFKFSEDSIIPDSIASQHKLLFEAANYRSTTVKQRQRQLGRAYGNLNMFLNLVGFIALLLGCLGVASAVHIYLKEKRSTVAILRCLGASGRSAFYIFLIQILFMGMLGSLVGVLLGSLAQQLLPYVLGNFLPIQNVSTAFSWGSAGLGFFSGMLISLLFALIPLRQIQTVSPLMSLRNSAASSAIKIKSNWIYLLIGLFIIGFAFYQTKSITTALGFTAGLIIALGVIWLLARLLIWSIKRFFPKSWNYVARQGLANLFRPNNQTMVLSITIGLGTTIILSLFFIQELLLQQVQISGSGNQPNTILFDIQPDQIDQLETLTIDKGYPIIQKVPIITTRIENIDGVTKKENSAIEDREQRRSRWVYNREYRVTYRDSLVNTETVIKGEWPKQPASGKIGISIASGVVEDFNVDIGSTILFNVQGALLETEVVAVREIDWNRLQTNFFVVFPEGALQAAPQFNVLVTRLESETAKTAYRNQIVAAFPNVSIIDLTGILKSVDSILSKLSFVIQFMALFSLLTGLIVLINSVLLSKYQRIREAVLLRTLGASGKQLLWVNAWEYLFLGLLAVGTGLLLSLGAAWGLAQFSFDLNFRPSLITPLLICGGILTLTLFIGLFNIRQVLSESPLQVIREI